MTLLSTFNRIDGTFARVDFGDLTSTPTAPFTLITSYSIATLSTFTDTTSVSGFTNYLMRGHNISLTTNNSINQQFSVNAGSSFFSAAGNYQATVYGSNTNAGAIASTMSNRAGLNITAIVSSTTVPVTFETFIFNPGGSFDTAFRVMSGYPTAAGNREALTVDGYLGSAGVNAVRWTVSAGTFSGVIEIYGLL